MPTPLAVCCCEVDLEVRCMFSPELMTPESREFFRMRGIQPADWELLKSQVAASGQKSGNIRIRHRCSKLADTGLCSVYEVRPQICREYHCRGTRACSSGCPAPRGLYAGEEQAYNLDVGGRAYAGNGGSGASGPRAAAPKQS